ncbi:angiopoietin-like protein 8 [Brachyhypopomus gauderio]|uniref:angiopoietin-like protein 8 n=1 Tax=Brachyhypopomus gauderio TaxID=698409 RepID=UPI004041E1B2
MPAVLCLFLCVWACTWAEPSPPASVDEMNVLMYGVLQFGESLHHVHQSTGDRLSRASRALRRTETLLQRLGHDTEQASRTEHHIREGLSLIQAQMAALQRQAQQTRGLVNRVAQEEVEFKEKLANLEAKLNSSAPGRIRELKEAAWRHGLLLGELKSWTEAQRRQLQEHNQQLAKIQEHTQDVW